MTAMNLNEIEVIDSDGHIRERDEDIIPYLDPKYPRESLKLSALFPHLDGWRRFVAPERAEGFEPAHWLRFLDAAGIQRSVLYPTQGLAFGFIKDPAWAADLARAYNDSLYHRFLKQSPRLQAVALLPVQDPDAAARELRRAVEDLGMVGGVLPAVGLRLPYGDTTFDPLYEAAQSLGTMLAIHGAPQQQLGIDFLSNPRAGFILEHPLSQMIQFTSMVCDRVFLRFPRLKAAFLEAGCGWATYMVERIDRKTDGAASEQVRNHPIYFHTELTEEALPYAIAKLGDGRFLYASDYPHELAAEITEDLQHFLVREDLGADSKRRILCDNIKAMYARS